MCLICNGKEVGKTRIAKHQIAHKQPPHENSVVLSPMEKPTEYADDNKCTKMISVMYMTSSTVQKETYLCSMIWT